MANLADAIRQSFVNNLGQEGIKRAYSNVTGADSESDEEVRKRKARLAALKRHISSQTVETE